MEDKDKELRKLELAVYGSMVSIVIIFVIIFFVFIADTL